jgi:hypothetical protein
MSPAQSGLILFASGLPDDDIKDDHKQWHTDVKKDVQRRRKINRFSLMGDVLRNLCNKPAVYARTEQKDKNE